MFRIALQTLAHDRGKLAASLAGVAFAATLVLVQVGLYAGFQVTSSSVISRVGGDAWVMARRTEVLDNGEALSSGSRSVVAGHPCVSGVRAVVQSFVNVRKPSGARDAAVVVGVDPDPRRIIPWVFSRGLPQDLHGPLRVAVDEGDLGKLQLTGEPLGATLEVNGRTVHVAALTRGIRSFTLTPYVFTEVDTARRLTGLGHGQAHFWVADLRDVGCTEGFVRWVNRHPDLEAHTTRAFAELTEAYWVGGSGAGTALGFSALLGLVVGAVIVGQTLYAITKEHLKELATLKALGATDGEIVSFVAWQASVLAVAGGSLGVAMSFGLQRLLEGVGLTVVLSRDILGLGAGAIVGMCAAASAGSVRAVLKLEAAEVFR